MQIRDRTTERRAYTAFEQLSEIKSVVKVVTYLTERGSSYTLV